MTETTKKPEDKGPTVEEMTAELKAAKEKLSESARESLALHESNKIYKAKIDAFNEPGKGKTPEDVARERYSEDWDNLDATQRSIVTTQVTMEKKLAKLDSSMEQQQTRKQRANHIEDFLADQNNEFDLSGKELEFKKFANMKTHRVIEDMTTLAKLFTYEHGGGASHSGSVLPTGKGGHGKVTAADGKVSMEEAKRLRSSDPARFARLQKAGKIDYGI